MWQKALSVGGGGAINPTLVASYFMARGETKEYSIDSTKNYILTVGYRIGGNDQYRTSGYFIKGTTKTDLTNKDSVTYITVTTNGSKITLSSTSATGYYYDVTLIQLD